jgi:hypothetical protein
MVKNSISNLSYSKKLPIIFCAFMALLFVGSYFSFSSYKPKIIKQVQDVKNLENENISDVPIIEGAEKTSVNKSTVSTQTTFYTNKSKEEVQDYYRNIFDSNKWALESQGNYQDFVVTKYKKDDQAITITAYDNQTEYKTLVSLEIVNQ